MVMLKEKPSKSPSRRFPAYGIPEAHILFRGLAEPVRLRIAILLLDKELCVCDLIAVLKLPQSTVSRHMARLKASGIVADRRDGKWIHYRYIDTPLVDELRAFIRRNYAEIDPYCNDLKFLEKYLATRTCK